MQTEERILNGYQIEILKKVVTDSVKAISYHKPQKQLGDVVENKSHDETIDALSSLENHFRVLDFDSAIKFGRSRCGYLVNLGKAKELYSSVQEKESDSN